MHSSILILGCEHQPHPNDAAQKLSCEPTPTGRKVELRARCFLYGCAAAFRDDNKHQDCCDIGQA